MKKLNLQTITSDNSKQVRFSLKNFANSFSTFFYCFAFLVLSLVFLTGAKAFSMPADQFEDAIIEAQKKCPHLNCHESRVIAVEVSESEYRKIEKDDRLKIKNLVIRQAEDLWGDTILEGPYENLGRYRIDSVQKILIDGALSGYRVTYSDRAWDTDTCNYDPTDKKTLKNCTSGRIVESAFVDVGLTKVYRDLEAMAQFIAGME